MGITQNTGASSLIKPGVIDNTAARPASPYEGQVIFQKDTDQLLVWNGTAWVIPNAPAQNPTGLELITTVTCSSGGTASNGIITIGSGVSSVVVTNAFSSTYDNYKIMISGGGNGTGGRQFKVQLGSTTSGYHYWLSYSAWSGTALSEGSKVAINFPYSGVSNSTASGGGQSMNMDIYNPFLSTYTRTSAFWDDDTSNAGFVRGGLFNTTSYTGFTLTADGASMTGGTITVYGYRK